ncbi:MAG TPA: glucose-1-phosphate thymidylyltransferase [Bacteroidetes bacterium]|nr:glucose-1-phosphate thymidylyltransferase [Bacteroidota bacterium]
MQYLLFEDKSRFDLLPLTFTRPVYALRVGIDCLQEKWQRALGSPLATFAYTYLQPRFESYNPEAETLFINGKFVPNDELLRLLHEGCAPATFLHTASGEIIAARCIANQVQRPEGVLSLEALQNSGLRPVLADLGHTIAIRYPWDIFRNNGAIIRQDYLALTARRKSAPITDKFSAIYGKDNIFIEAGVKLRANVINAEDGPIYLGKNVTLQEGAMLHGTHALCDHAVLSMGAKMRGDSTIGPYSKVGGEVGNSVIQGYSNKGHDGYLGNSVLGQWCNLGADTNTSNLKNNYSEVRVWNYPEGRFAPTGSIFCGLIMGDHSKCGINTMFNTGTIVGVSANIFGSGYPRTFIPSFSWGGSAGFSTYQMRKVKEVAAAVMQRRKIEFGDEEANILQSVFELTAPHRRWETK